MSTVESAGPLRMMTMAAVAVLTASVLTGPAAAAEPAAVAAPPEKITVDVLTVNGSGCPAGSASTRVSPDNTGFHISYSDFVARDGSGATPTAFRKNCQVALQIHIPQGFTYAVASAEYRGRAMLAGGATALQRSNYYFQGDSNDNFVDHPFSGPMYGSWRTTDRTEINELVYAPCGRTVILNVNTELRVNSPGSPSWISLRSSDGDVDTLINFNWKHC